jgi:hypothetical protein
MNKTMIMLGSLLLLLPVSANAQKGMVRKACGADIKQFCGDVKPGGGRIVACAKAHVADFSEPCKKTLFTTAIVIKACKADAKDKCAGMKPAEIGACFKEHFADLSEACKDSLLLAKMGRS